MLCSRNSNVREPSSKEPERAARTYLVGQGVLDQTQVNLVAALKRSDFKAE
jgi:hypothetical protein